jgi:hypothetical protein
MCTRNLLKETDETMWIVANHGRHEEKFVIEQGPTTKEDAEYYLGKNPRYEIIELKVVSRRRGGSRDQVEKEPWQMPQVEFMKLYALRVSDGIADIRAEDLVGGGGDFRLYLKEMNSILLKSGKGVELWQASKNSNEFYILGNGRYIVIHSKRKALFHFSEVVKDGGLLAHLEKSPTGKLLHEIGCNGVSNALYKGKLVSDAVLNDYPALKEKFTALRDIAECEV